MSLAKNLIVESIEIVQSGCIHVRTKTVITENEIKISETSSLHMIAPGDDFSAEDSRVKAICAVVHTPEVIAAYQAMQPK